MLVKVAWTFTFRTTSMTMMATATMPIPAKVRSGRWGLDSHSESAADCSLTDKSSPATWLKPDSGNRSAMSLRAMRQVSTIFSGSRLRYMAAEETLRRTGAGVNNALVEGRSPSLGRVEPQIAPGAHR